MFLFEGFTSYANSKHRGRVTIEVLGGSAFILGTGLLDVIQAYAEKFEGEGKGLGAVGFIPLTVLEYGNTIAGAYLLGRDLTKYMKSCCCATSTMASEEESLLPPKTKEIPPHLVDIMGRTAATLSSGTAAVALSFAVFRSDLADYNPILFSVATGLLAVAKASPPIAKWLKGEIGLGEAIRKAGREAGIVTLAFVSLMVGLNELLPGGKLVNNGAVTASGIAYMTDTAFQYAVDIFDTCCCNQEKKAGGIKRIKSVVVNGDDHTVVSKDDKKEEKVVPSQSPSMGNRSGSSS